LPLISLLAGIAAGRVLPIELKWPNDLMIGSNKVGGILVEGAGDVVTVGMGVNLWWPDPPEAMAGVFEDDPGDGLALRLAESWVAEMLALLDSGPEKWPVAEYRQKCQTLGRVISWKPDGAGTAIDVEPDGGLRVRRSNGTVEVIRTGEVRRVR
jgi:biotin-(acetyl-CoA carboxylase) ligase